MKLLIVEDNKKLCGTIAKYLKDEGFATDCCYDGADADSYLGGTEYDAVILDIMLPHRDGLSILSALRRAGNSVPVILLTAKNSVRDRVSGLELGADDYLVKPFALAELKARINVLIRRKGRDTPIDELRCGDLRLDDKKKQALLPNREIHLTAREYQILEYLMMNRGTVLSRDKIEQHIWNYDYEGASNIIDVYIRSLRGKIDRDLPDDEKHIVTVRGMGYMIK